MHGRGTCSREGRLVNAADKLRELLATRPALPDTEALVRWWRTSAELVPVALADAERVKDARDQACEMLLHLGLTISQYEIAHQLLEVGKERAAELERAPLDERTETLVCGPRLDASIPFVDDEARCAVCGWPLATLSHFGCVRGDCSMRPRPSNLYAHERAVKEQA